MYTVSKWILCACEGCCYLLHIDVSSKLAVFLLSFPLHSQTSYLSLSPPACFSFSHPGSKNLAGSFSEGPEDVEVSLLLFSKLYSPAIQSTAAVSVEWLNLSTQRGPFPLQLLTELWLKLLSLDKSGVTFFHCGTSHAAASLYKKFDCHCRPGQN